MGENDYFDDSFYFYPDYYDNEVSYDVDGIESDVFSDNDGFLREDVPLEESREEGEENSSVENESGSDNDIVRDVIDYSKLEATVRDAQIINTLDSDLDDLPISDVILLIIVLFLGLIIVGGKHK